VTLSALELGPSATPAASILKGDDPLRQRALDLARELVTLLVFGLLAVGFRPTLLYVLADRVRASPGASFGYGILVLILAFVGGALAAVVLGFVGFVVSLGPMCWRSRCWSGVAGAGWR
jgi:hypothetical protein